jgi:two-component system, OmpR family, sensor histidine kinase KdpD
MNSRRTLVVTRWMLVVGALAGIVLVYKRWFHVNPTTVALTLLLLVLMLAARWGLRYAVFASLAATACYNFFFLPPLNTFTISDSQNWLALFAFLSTSIIASRLSQRVRDEADEARSRQRELDTLFRLSRELLQSESVAALLSSLPATVVGITGAKSGYLYLLEGNRLYQTGGASVADIEFAHLARLSELLTQPRRQGDDLELPVRSGVRPRGIFVLHLTQLSVETASAIAGLISLALDRAQALENLARGEATKENERLRTLMIDSITHELRTPLTSIKGAVTTLLTGGLAEDDTHEMLSIIDEESDRLNRLVSEAVEMARLDTHQVQMNMKTIGVRELVAEAIETSGWIKTQHTVRIDVPETLQTKADPVFLQKVICNLLENAAKYSADGTPIAVSGERNGDGTSISVADRGVGIDPSEQPLIFERFYRAKSHTETTPGTGMGLAISRAIVKAHGGEIKVTSQPGRGSVFTIRLPQE